MDQQYQTLFNIAVALVGMLGGWLLKTVTDELKILRAAYDRLKDDITNNYARRDDFKDLTKAMFEKLDRIEDKLDGKVDKQ